MLSCFGPSIGLQVLLTELGELLDKIGEGLVPANVEAGSKETAFRIRALQLGFLVEERSQPEVGIAVAMVGVPQHDPEQEPEERLQVMSHLMNDLPMKHLHGHKVERPLRQGSDWNSSTVRRSTYRSLLAFHHRLHLRFSLSVLRPPLPACVSFQIRLRQLLPPLWSQFSPLR